MKPVQNWLAEYAESHQNPINIMIHWICVPLIMLSIIGLLANINIPFSDDYPSFNHAGFLLIILGFIYYFFLSKTLLLGMIPISFTMLKIIQELSTLSYPLWLISLIIFIVSWIGQFYGHKIEGKKPSFFKDIQFLMIGPLWLLSKLYKKLGISI
tara:strand:- start:1018 stop:1482 length:465 start_codon:yes stop_codon:yes gene_type:complete